MPLISGEGNELCNLLSLFLSVEDRYQSVGSAEVKCKCVKNKNLIGNTSIMSSIVLKWSNLFPECCQNNVHNENVNVSERGEGQRWFD